MSAAWSYRKRGDLYTMYRSGQFIGTVNDEHAAKRLTACANACEGIVDTKAVPEMLDALATALPYVEMAEHDPDYKLGAVKKVTEKLRALIEGAKS